MGMAIIERVDEWIFFIDRADRAKKMQKWARSVYLP